MRGEEVVRFTMSSIVLENDRTLSGGRVPEVASASFLSVPFDLQERNL
jgi:hypothetical protein